MKDVMRREAEWEEEKATRRNRREQQDVEDKAKWLLAKKMDLGGQQTGTVRSGSLRRTRWVGLAVGID